jgi:hypothetical protein
MKLAGGYLGTVVMGLNRGKNNIQNTIAAAKMAVQNMGNLLAVELGNEPECASPIIKRPSSPQTPNHSGTRLVRRPTHRLWNVESG